ncbi:protein methyltransferase, partial [Aureobasidium melanogenum]|uniref:Protein methyltransferase n=1 Tax=Aureobasidium melanogenum (strain CBS 110374) TaxID=1043003 RepID=A0A074WK54_AURM1
MGLTKFEKLPEDAVPLTRHSDIKLVLDTPKGRGVFAAARIPAHTVLETCPVLVLDPTENKEHIEKTELFHYTYNWPYTCPKTQKQLTTQAVILGLGSMFNHSTQHQNVGWERNVANKVIVYKTLREIEEGEELCISYGSRLWFKDADVGEEEDEGDGLGVLGGIEV